MLKKIEYLIKSNKQRFVALMGLPGSGKSTIAAVFECNGYIVVCPDRIRHELAQLKSGNAGKYESELEDILQSYSAQAFQISASRISEHIKNGKSVIFDATSLTVKSRKQILEWGRKNNISVDAIYVDCPVELAVERNIRRSRTVVAERDGELIYGRYVPSHIIELKSSQQVLPSIREGFNDIHILHVFENDITILENAKEKLELLHKTGNIEKTLTEWKEKDLLKIMLPTFDECWGINQENINHIYPLHTHMIKAAEYLREETFPLFMAGLLHDIGKIKTKKFYGKMVVDTELFKAGEKVEVKVGENGFVSCRIFDYNGERQELLTIKHVEVDNNAHFYEHHIVGALIARRELSMLGFEEDVLNKIYEYILYHMLAHQLPTSEKGIVKMINKVGKENIPCLFKIFKADRISGKEDTGSIAYFDEIEKLFLSS